MIFTQLKGSLTLKIELFVSILNDQENRKQIPKQKQNPAKTNKPTKE